MTEELKPVEGEQKPVEQQQETVVELSEIETRALEMGWRPKEEFDGSEDEFIDAKEFVRRAPLFEKIGQQSRELKAVRQALESFKDHYTRVKETEYKRALSELKNTQKAALKEGDVDQFYALDSQIESIEQEAETLRQEQAAIQTEAPKLHPHFVSWVQRNSWYENQPHMRVYADDVGKRLASQGVAPDDVLKQVEAAVRKEFPTKFTNPRRADAPAVEGSGVRRSTPAKGKEPELTEQERQIMNTLVRGGHITKEKYLEDLQKVKG